MTVDDVKIRIAEMEGFILQRLEQFEQDTGCLCLGVAVDHIDVTTKEECSQGKKSVVISNVQLDVSVIPDERRP
jgi:hypothetical protein